MERITVDGVPIKFKPETVEEIDVELANVLRSKLSKDQWEECFEEKIVPEARHQQVPQDGRTDRGYNSCVHPFRARKARPKRRGVW